MSRTAPRSQTHNTHTLWQTTPALTPPAHQPIAFLTGQAWIITAYVYFMMYGEEYSYDGAVRTLARARKVAAKAPK